MMFYIAELSKEYFIENDQANEKDYINFLQNKINEAANYDHRAKKILEFFDFINWKYEEELLEHINDYNLVLLPFEGLTNYFIKFFITSNLKEDTVAAFGFNLLGEKFYIDFKGNSYFTKRKGLKKILIERKEKNYDIDYEIKSRAFVIDLFMDKYQREDFFFPYSPNYSFLSTLFGHYDKLYSLGYDLNDIEDLAFANFFYSNLKEKPKKVEFLNVDIDNVFVLR